MKSSVRFKSLDFFWQKKSIDLNQCDWNQWFKSHWFKSANPGTASSQLSWTEISVQLVSVPLQPALATVTRRAVRGPGRVTTASLLPGWCWWWLTDNWTKPDWGVVGGTSSARRSRRWTTVCRVNLIGTQHPVRTRLQPASQPLPLCTRMHCCSGISEEYAVRAYTTADSAVSYLNHARIAQVTPSFALWPAAESCDKSTSASWVWFKFHAGTRIAHWLAILQAISDPYCQTLCLWLCLSAARLEPRDNVRATLQSLLCREPRRLPDCIMLHRSVYRHITCWYKSRVESSVTKRTTVYATRPTVGQRGISVS